jgi:hypothetical protein
VPEWVHINAYPYTFSDYSHLGRHCETPAIERINRWLASKPGLIAMQKVEGSNPFSRFCFESIPSAAIARGLG